MADTAQKKMRYTTSFLSLSVLMYLHHSHTATRIVYKTQWTMTHRTHRERMLRSKIVFCSGSNIVPRKAKQIKGAAAHTSNFVEIQKGGRKIKSNL